MPTVSFGTALCRGRGSPARLNSVPGLVKDHLTAFLLQHALPGCLLALEPSRSVASLPERHRLPAWLHRSAAHCS